jgi:tetratricopeptide (TPR) repeat protein
MVLAYYYARDYQHALEQAMKALELNPNNYQALVFLGSTYEQMGDYPKAVETWTKTATVSGREATVKQRIEVFKTSGYSGYLLRDASDSEAEGAYGDAAADYAMLGQKEAAFAALDKAIANRANLSFVKSEPEYDKIRSDPRFAEVLRRIGVSQ